MPKLRSLTPCLWFDGRAEEAARFYTGIFPDSRIVTITRYAEAGREIHGHEPGSVLTVVFELAGNQFTALNGGPQFTFSEAVSFMVECDTQADVDHFWNALGAGGDPAARQCGWLKDRFGLSWQIVPAVMLEVLASGDRARIERAMGAMMPMKKLDVAALTRAAAG